MLHISKGISKFGGLAIGIGMPPENTCRPDAPCVPECYGRRGRFVMQTVKTPLQENYELWKEDPMKFIQDAINECSAVRYVRWFQTGDIPDDAFVGAMQFVALQCPKTQFLAFTKKYELINEFLDNAKTFPKNLKIVLSSWGDWQPENPYNIPVAYIKFKDPNRDSHIPAKAKLCPGSCADCIKNAGGGCWKMRKGQAVYFNQH